MPVDVWGSSDELSNTYAVTNAQDFTFTTDEGPIYYIPVTTYPDPAEFSVDIDGLPQYVDEHFGYVKAERKITFSSTLPSGLKVHIRVAATAIIQAPDFPVSPTPIGNAIIGAADAASVRSILELGNAAQASVGSGIGQVAAGSHLHDIRYSQLGHTHSEYEPVITAPAFPEGKFLAGDKTFKAAIPYVTGIISGGLLSAAAGTSVFSITAGTLQVVDDYTVPGTPSVTRNAFTAKTGVADSYASSSQTYIGLDSTGSIVQQTTPFTSTQLRTIASIGVIAKSGGLIIASSPIVTTAYNADQFPHDLARSLGSVVSGLMYSGVAASLQLSRSSGAIFRSGSNISNSLIVPNEVSLASQSPVNFAVYSRNSSNTVWSNSGILTALNPAVYDNGGVSTNGIPSAALSTNNWQAIRIWCSPNGNTLLQYGAASYNSLTAAQAGVASETFYPAPITQSVPFRGYLFVRGGAVNLADTGDALFQSAGKLGDVTVAVSSSVTVPDATFSSKGIVQLSASVPGTPYVRPTLIADITYYVRTDGNDSNSGLTNTSGGAFLTIQKALNVVGSLDLGIYTATIQVADGTYTAALTLPTLVGAGSAILKGNTTTPDNCIISTSAGSAISAPNITARWKVEGFKLSSSATNGDAITAYGNAVYLQLGNNNYGTCSRAQVFAYSGAAVEIVSNYTISGGSQYHVVVNTTATWFLLSRTITLTGTPAFSACFISATQTSSITWIGCTFTGSATGVRYGLYLNCVCNTGTSGSATYFPGNTAGTATTGAQYV